MVAAFAARGFRVIGVDVNADFVRLINEGRSSVFEPHLEDYLRANKSMISATQNYEEAVLNSDITFIIVPTPSDNNNDFSMKYVVEVGKKIGEAIKKKKTFHLVVLTSTVTPSSTQRELLPVLARSSQKQLGRDFGLCYNPEFIALGEVIEDILNPDFVLIGESDKRSGDILEEFYKNVCQNNPPIKKMSIINAEITKIALNTYVTTKISYANMLAELCEAIPGGNVDVVTDALGCDTRIGQKYLKGALGYMGPCFPRDGRAFMYTAKKFGISLPITQATDEINRRQVPRLQEKVLRLVPKKGKIAVLGVAYKPNTNIIEESQGLEFAKVFSEKEFQVKVYDPKAMAEAKKSLNNALFSASLKEAVGEADLIFIATPWEEFKNMKPAWLKHGVVLFDCWRILDPRKYEGIAKYIPLGVNVR
ncbi:MAG: UDPglucose 6-dehydrogenase [Parcubacteria group bacterium Gr01-1014_30]|nr:MAG: UDPglucose 6-dehydrogenase [Parcubacteria group bacterium Gr01-1014_30]